MLVLNKKEKTKKLIALTGTKIRIGSAGVPEPLPIPRRGDELNSKYLQRSRTLLEGNLFSLT